MDKTVTLGLSLEAAVRIAKLMARMANGGLTAESESEISTAKEFQALLNEAIGKAQEAG